MNATTVLLDLVNGYKTYSAAILAIATGVGAILSKNYSQGTADILQALTFVFGGASVVGLRHAVAKVPTGVLQAAARHD
jgi:multidrug transporter EmrE-like cation transporter